MKYSKARLSDYIEFNPKEQIPKGVITTEVSMANIEPFTKHISNKTKSMYRGGMKFRNGDTIVARITPCLENGKTAYVDILKEDEVGFGSTEYIVLRAIPNKTVPEFIYYLARSDKFREKAISLMTGTSGRQRVQTDALMQEEFDFPSICDQKKIATVLSLLDEKIRCNNRTNDNLLEISKTIFSNDFSDKIRGGKEIGDYLVPKRGKALLSKDAIKGDIPVIAGGLEPATFHNLSNTKAPVITISASGANAGFVNLWQREVWSSDSSFIDATITENPFFWYVMLVVRQDEIYKAQTGSAQAHIYPKHIAEMSIGDIKQSEISTYEKKVASIFEQIEQNKTENRRLTKLRDTLLPELLNGRIDISNIDV